MVGLYSFIYDKLKEAISLSSRVEHVSMVNNQKDSLNSQSGMFSYSCYIGISTSGAQRKGNGERSEKNIDTGVNQLFVDYMKDLVVNINIVSSSSDFDEYRQKEIWDLSEEIIKNIINIDGEGRMSFIPISISETPDDNYSEVNNYSIDVVFPALQDCYLKESQTTELEGYTNETEVINT